MDALYRSDDFKCVINPRIHSTHSVAQAGAILSLSAPYPELFVLKSLQTLPPMIASSGLDTTHWQSPGPLRPDLMSKTTKIMISQSETKLVDSASHRPTSAMVNGILFRMLPSYASFASMLLVCYLTYFWMSHLDSATGTSPTAAVSSQPPRVKELPPTDNPTASLTAPALPVAASRSREATARRGDISDFDIELDGRSRAGQVTRWPGGPSCLCSSSACDPHPKSSIGASH